MNVDANINTLKRDNRTCHDSSSVFSFRIETRYLNRIFCINGASLFVFFFITSVSESRIVYKSSEIQDINKMTHNPIYVHVYVCLHKCR